MGRKNVNDALGIRKRVKTGAQGGGGGETEDRDETRDFHIYEAVVLFACCSVLVHCTSI
jgi:hypothetical protein